MSRTKILPRSQPRQPKPPTYECIRTLTGWWVGRSDGDVFQLVERFNRQEDAEDFMSFCTEVVCTEVAQARRRLAGH